MKNLIGKELIDFEVQAYHEGDFKTVTKEDVLGKWGVFFFYPADFTFVCPTELADVADNYEAVSYTHLDVYKRQRLNTWSSLLTRLR